jgi:single-stranded DNA-specific DHH superfamily exonuclease
MVSGRIGDKRLAAATVTFVVYTTVMLVLERRMRQTGGPGIIPFELAGSASRAEDMMTRWGSDGQRAARLSLWLDFGYMATYGTFAALLVDRARRRRGHPAALPAIVIVAVVADAMEGVSLLKVLDRTRVTANSRRAQIAALIKFAVLAGALGYVVTGRFISDARIG